MTPPNPARIAALRAEIAERRAEIDELPAGSRPRLRLEADLQRLEAELATLEAGAAPDPTIQVDQSAQQSGNSAGAFNTFNQSAHIGDVFQQHNYYGAEAADVAPLLRTYLNELAGACSRLSLADAASLDPQQAPLDLQAVYVGLEVSRRVDLPPADPAQLREQVLKTLKQAGYELQDFAGVYGDTSEAILDALVEQLAPKEKQRPLRVLEALAEHERLVLTGDPGSGKSSFVNFVAFALARAWCGETAWLEQLGDDWPHGPLLPIRVVLREFAAWLAACPALPPADPGLLWQWLEQGAGLPRLLVQHLRAAVADRKALLLFDGLDEAPAGRPLQQIIAVITAFGRGPSRTLVTCRVLDYQQPARQLADWPVDQIAPLSPALRKQLIAHWFTALERLQRPTRGAYATLRDGLQQAIQARPELRRLAGNPLLLTMMIRLQAHDGELPGERVTLYQRSVDLLLLDWRRDAHGRAALAELLELPQWSDSFLNRLLDRLAYVAHIRSVSGDTEQGADLPRQLLLDTAAEFFAPYGVERDLIRAQTFLNYISEHGNGIIQRFDQQIYRFPHRTFQEYLAGRRLISDEGWPADLPEFEDRAVAVSAQGPQWREAVLLAVSHHALSGRLRPVLRLAEELFVRYQQDQTGGNLLLAAEILLEVGRERVAARNPALWDELHTTLAAVLQARDSDGAARYSVAKRVRAGFLLGQFGDPRTPIAIDQWQAALQALPDPQPDVYFCPIPAGAYLIGSPADDPDAQEHEQPQHDVRFDQPYWIARLPITNAQWAAYVAAGGEESRYADDPDLNAPNQPVVGITWYEAQGFCTWLSEQLAGALPAGYVIRLPTEAEWEAAARGPAAWRYPWGDDWQSDCAAMEDDQATRNAPWTTPVGCYPAGAAACGALDMAGNVWEWTLDRWQSYPGAAKAFTNERPVVVRGGAYHNDRTFVRCGARNWSYPDYRYNNQGFRVVAAPALAQMS
jgi:formylglycine-generating enzyme required for sulfatase activity